MLLLNESKRLIKINVIGGKQIMLMPAGDVVEVDEDVCKTKYVKALIKEGSVKATESKVVDDDNELFTEMTKAELTDIAESMGIEVNSRMTKAELIDLIEE